MIFLDNTFYFRYPEKDPVSNINRNPLLKNINDYTESQLKIK